MLTTQSRGVNGLTQKDVGRFMKKKSRSLDVNGYADGGMHEAYGGDKNDHTKEIHRKYVRTGRTEIC